jgi:dihydrofolate synthase/folylpolyglutamate synthase
MIAMQYAAYKRAQKYLEALPQQVFAPRHQQPELSLERTRRLLKHVGNPERKFQYVHITGTSGKGTVSTMVYEMLRASGKHVGLFTSPHVTTTLERIALDGRLTSVDDFLWAFRRLKPYVDLCLTQERKYVPSHFETLLAMAMLIFRRRNIRWVVLEVGCGGEFDPTNIITAPKVVAITNIGLDHQHLLGRTKAKIAWTKAGIFKKGSQGISAETNPQIRAVLQNRAHHAHMPLTFVRTSPHALHKEKNQKLAIAIGTALRLPVQAIVRGVRNAKLAARIERISPNIIVDGSHNPDKLTALAQTIRVLDYKRVHVIFGIGNKKDVAKSLRPLLRLATRWTITRANVAYPVPMPPKRIAKALTKLRPAGKIVIQPNAWRALQQAFKTQHPEELLLVTGSFYLAGELRQHWISERYILIHRTPFR